MATLNEDIVSFIISAQAKLTEYGVRVKTLIESGEERSKEFEDIMDQTEILDWIISSMYEATYDIVDSNQDKVYNFITKTDVQIREMISDWRYLFGMDIYPYSDVSLSTYTFIQEQEQSGSGGLSLPSGGSQYDVFTRAADGTGYWATPTVYFEVVNY